MQQWEGQNPFEQVFTVNKEKSENGYIVWNIPSFDDAAGSRFSMEVEFQTGHIPRWANRSINSLR